MTCISGSKPLVLETTMAEMAPKELNTLLTWLPLISKSLSEFDFPTNQKDWWGEHNLTYGFWREQYILNAKVMMLISYRTIFYQNKEKKYYICEGEHRRNSQPVFHGRHCWDGEGIKEVSCSCYHYVVLQPQGRIAKFRVYFLHPITVFFFFFNFNILN